MSWKSNIVKINSIIEATERVLQEYLKMPPEDTLNELVREFESSLISPSQELVPYTSALFLRENPKEYPLKHKIYDARTAAAFLINNDVSIGGFDASYFSPGPHIAVPIVLINVGYWFQNYGQNSGGDGCKSEGFLSIPNRIELQFLVKEVERKVIKELANNLDGALKVVFFDESFNITHTMSWSNDARRRMAKEVQESINLCIKNNIIPVAIFFTRANDLTRGISIVMSKSIEMLPRIPDNKFFQHYLRNIGSRSPLFTVYSKPLSKTKLKLVCFYLKIGERDVIRVEFPERYADLADVIQSIVFSQALLGNGYPLALQRAHEIAVIRKEERMIIENTILRILRKPNIEYILSKKSASKRWPIA